MTADSGTHDEAPEDAASERRQVVALTPLQAIVFTLLIGAAVIWILRRRRANTI